MTTHLTTTHGADEFYPTPKALAAKMLSHVDWSKIETVLEPSAGKGDLVEFVARKVYEHRHNRHRRQSIAIDCIEIDEHLRAILKHSLAEKKGEWWAKYNKLDKIYTPNLTKAQLAEKEKAEREYGLLNNAKVRIIHDDFLTYSGVKRYDLIVMNPPFSNGDKHLLKAIELQRDGGEIVCLLNAETVRNLYTNSRQLLKQQLDKHGAHIQFVKDGFTGAAGAERITNVEVAIIKVFIPRKQERVSEFWERMKKAEELKAKPVHEVKDVALSGFLENIISLYNVEVAASIKLIEEYNALKPYIHHEFVKEGERKWGSAILTLTVGTDRNSLQKCDINDYLKAVRHKYWAALFANEQFTGKLTSNLQTKYRDMVSKMSDYDFTMFNINTVLVEMNSEMTKGVQDTILDLFETLSAQHSYFPDSKNNIHYYNGWKTNKAHKVNHKVIIPTWGMFSTWDRGRTFEVSKAYHVLSDIEKVFNYLDGGETAEFDLHGALSRANDMGKKQNIECKYFTVSLFKKGTTHIKFKNQKLVDKLNIYAARNKKWLPPNYGKTHYADMSADEQEVINEFQGAVAYQEVMANPAYYLFDAATAVLQIEHVGEVA